MFVVAVVWPFTNQITHCWTKQKKKKFKSENECWNKHSKRKAIIWYFELDVNSVQIVSTAKCAINDLHISFVLLLYDAISSWAKINFKPTKKNILLNEQMKNHIKEKKTEFSYAISSSFCYFSIYVFMLMLQIFLQWNKRFYSLLSVQWIDSVFSSFCNWLNKRRTQFKWNKKKKRFYNALMASMGKP